MKIESVVRLPPEDSGLQHAIVRLNNRNMDSRRIDRARFFRREPLIITNLADGSAVLRYAMGNSGQSICKNQIGLDYDAVDALSIKYKQSVELDIRRARFWEIWLWFWRHPDQSLQLSIKLGFVGSVLGAMGFLIGIAPLLTR